MTRSPAARLAGLLIAWLACLGGSVLPLAHGWAHHEEREHRQGEHGEHHSAPGGDVAVSAPDARTHDHVQLGAAVSARNDDVLASPAELPHAAPVAPKAEGVRSFVPDHQQLARADPRGVASARPRAPPLP